MLLSCPRLRTIHANVTERCIRRARGKHVQVDHLLVSRRADRLEFAAVYWAVEVGAETFPEICEAHFVLKGEAQVQEILAPRRVCWTAYAWEITPNGHLRYLR